MFHQLESGCERGGSRNETTGFLLSPLPTWFWETCQSFDECNISDSRYKKIKKTEQGVADNLLLASFTIIDCSCNSFFRSLKKK